ncbi:hypothetical protein SAY87_013215 [Trapa incisa]|uniref:Uncharacterized protein n=1 Tax=Trapa incisa TaxID=236973 RepID=A0AAN7KHS2_9MYRT|nr:hypothetical protein SAY87_013215 [Trapa incisa]
MLFSEGFMDTLLMEPSSFLGELKFNHGSISISQDINPENGFNLGGGFSNLVNNLSPHSSAWSDAESPEYNDTPTSNSVLQFISEILMEEDLDEQPDMLQDCLALQAAEKSFYDVINQEYAPSSNPSECFLENSVQESSYDSSSNVCSCYNSDSVGDTQAPGARNLMTPCMHLTDSLSSKFKLLDPCSVAGEIEGNALLGRVGTLGGTRDLVSEGSQIPSRGSKVKRIHRREEEDFPREGRNNKHSAVSIEEPEQLEMFDKVLLCMCQGEKDEQTCHAKDSPEIDPNRKVAEQWPAKGSHGKSGTRKKKNSAAAGEVVDLWTLLTQCAQAVAINDQRNSMELIKQIRLHSSPCGDGNQRLAYYVVKGLEARLAGTESPSYSCIARQASSAADILKAYQFYVEACPFKRMSNFFANRTIMRKAQKAATIHIIHFGILYGFQWPCFIQRISKRGGGPPKIRMTGIELPQPGFRPSERVEETGRRLAKYCKRFGVEFEYDTIAKKWETIQLEELKINRDDFIVVNCLYRFKNLPDESVVMSSPRDMVLKLIRKIEPDLFVHGVDNGTYSAPFFLTRFREALFHFSSLFDMFDVRLEDRKNEQRMVFEQEFFGRDAMNVIACEGVARIERPETYKQWQIRNMRAGFRQISLCDDIFKEVKRVVRSEYHRDFVIDQDGNWMLLGWKGRVIHAVSCWIPA